MYYLHVKEGFHAALLLISLPRRALPANPTALLQSRLCGLHRLSLQLVMIKPMLRDLWYDSRPTRQRDGRSGQAAGADGA
jgi:hypothetical protein